MEKRPLPSEWIKPIKNKDDALLFIHTLLRHHLLVHPDRPVSKMNWRYSPNSIRDDHKVLMDSNINKLRNWESCYTLCEYYEMMASPQIVISLPIFYKLTGMDMYDECENMEIAMGEDTLHQDRWFIVVGISELSGVIFCDLAYEYKKMTRKISDKGLDMVYRFQNNMAVMGMDITLTNRAKREIRKKNNESQGKMLLKTISNQN